MENTAFEVSKEEILATLQLLNLAWSALEEVRLAFDGDDPLQAAALAGVALTHPVAQRDLSIVNGLTDRLLAVSGLDGAAHREALRVDLRTTARDHLLQFMTAAQGEALS